MAGTVRSTRNLMTSLSGSNTTPILSVEILGQEIEVNAAHLLNGSLFYRKSSDASVERVKELTDETKFQFITKLSKFIDVDAEQCLDLFNSYIKYEYKGTQKNLKTRLAVEHHIQLLLYELWNYYYSERLYSLMAMKHILEHWKDESDCFQVLYNNFIKIINKNGIIATNILMQVEQMHDLKVPTKDNRGLLVNDALIKQWAIYMLREYGLLLHNLLLYRKVMTPSTVDIEAMFFLFQKHGFGLRQPFYHLVDENIQNSCEQIGFLEVILVLQSFELHILFQNAELKVHPLMQEEKCVKALDTAIQALGSHRSHGPILLAWMLIGQCTRSSFINNCHRLGNTSLQLGVFDYIVSHLQSKHLKRKEMVTETVHKIVYDMMCVLLSQFEIESLGSPQPLYAIAESVMRFPTIAENVWQKGLDVGIGLLLKCGVETFPSDFCQMLNLAAALAEAGVSSSQKVMEFISKLPFFTEFVESTNMHDIAATHEPSIFRLTRNKALYNDETLVLPEGTLGILLQERSKNGGKSAFQWHNEVNGWQIILREIYLQYEEILSNIGSITAINMLKITSVIDLLIALLKQDSEKNGRLRHIIDILFSIFQRLSTHPEPPLALLAKNVELAAILCTVECTDVWRFLTQMNFLPYMSSPSKNMTDLITGLSMNMGTLGNIVALKECGFGKYSLCLAFLNLIDVVSDIENSSKFDEFFTACVIYVIREIFSSFHKWFYVDPEEKIQIGRSCLNIFNNLLTINHEKKIKSLSEIQQLCLYSFYHFEAGQTLLKIVCTGEAVIQQTILKQDCMQGENVITLIQLSLSILNCLLLMKHYLPEDKRNELKKSRLENALFVTPSLSDQPQVIITIAHYAFQCFCQRLARLAVQVLKRFTQEFPMLLLACFGSEAKAVRSHFLSRLGSPTEKDLRLKIGILEFFRLCIGQQPGVIEMFINIKELGKDKDIEIVDDEETESCLTEVINIIKTPIETSTPYAEELHRAAVEFIHELWSQHQRLAMEALEKQKDFWSLFCQNALSENFETVNSKILSYIIRTLALEFFYMSIMRYGEAQTSDIKQIISAINDKNILQRWSSHINGSCPALNTSVNFADVSIIMDSNTEGTLSLYTAWRDFLLVIAKYHNTISLVITQETKNCIMKHILKNLLDQIAGDNFRLQILLAESYLILLHHWKNDFTTGCDMLQILCDLLEEIALNTDSITRRVELAIVYACTNFITVHTHSKNKESNAHELNDLIPFVCKLLRRASSLVDHTLKSDKLADITRFPTAVICLLNTLVLQTSECDWLPVLNSHVTLPLLASLLSRSLKLEAGVTISHTILTFFISIAATEKAANALYNTGFMPEITLLLSAVKLEPNNNMNIFDSVTSLRKKVTKTCVYYTFLQLTHVLLSSLGNYFITDALNFVGIHLENFLATFNYVKENPSLTNLDNAILTCSLVHQLSHHRQSWLVEHPNSLNSLLESISYCLNATIALFMRPTYLKHLIEHCDSPSKKKQFLQSEAGDHSKLMRLTSSQDDLELPEKVIQVQNKLLKFLSVCLSIMIHYSPGLYDTVTENIIDDGHWQLLFQINFVTPSGDKDEMISFGGIIACINACLRWLLKVERTPSPKRMQEVTFQIERNLLTHVLEISLTLLVTQSCLTLTKTELSKQEKQLLRRELSSELSVIMQMANRYLKKAPLSPVSGSMSSSSDHQRTQRVAHELPYIKLINSLMKQLVK